MRVVLYHYQRHVSIEKNFKNEKDKIPRGVPADGTHRYNAMIKDFDRWSDNKKPRIGVFIDAGNLYHTSARIGWRIDFGKLKNLLAHACDLSFINYHIVVPRKDDQNYAKTLMHIQKASESFTICQKPMKYIWSDEEQREIKKGDVDVDLAVDVVENFEMVDATVIVSGDSDYLALEKYVAARGKPLVFMGYKKNMAWELRLKNHMFFELIKECVEYGITTNPDLSAGATLTRLIIAKAIAESSASQKAVDKSKPRKTDSTGSPQEAP